MDALTNGRRIKCLTVVDDFTRECLDIAVDYGISGKRFMHVLERIGQFRGLRRPVRTDQGPEFTSRAIDHWACGHGILTGADPAGAVRGAASLELVRCCANHNHRLILQPRTLRTQHWCRYRGKAPPA